MKSKKTKTTSKQTTSLDSIMAIYKSVIDAKFNPTNLDVKEVEKALWEVDHNDLFTLTETTLNYIANAISTVIYTFAEDERKSLLPAFERILSYVAGIINSRRIKVEPKLEETITHEEVEVAKMYNTLTQYSVALNQKLNEAQQISNNMQALFAKLSSSLK